MPIGPLGSRRLARPLAALALLVPALGWAADVATPNKGDTAWMLASTAFVLLMSVPALALFYGGLVRTKNMLSVLMQVFVGFSLISVLWCVYGYSLAFTPGNRLIGGLSRLFLAGTFDPTTGAFSTVPTFSKNTTLYELVYVGFQATFAAITGCLILGAVVERIKFSAVLLFLFIWFTFSYCPIAHGVVLAWSGRPTPPPTRCPHSPRRPASSGAGVRPISRAVRWCTSTPASPAWSEPTCSASASASAASRCPRTA
jgi:Amt family ammonium transporter